MTIQNTVTQQRLHELFSYDPQTGHLIRRITTAPNAKQGDIAGCPSNGYLLIWVGGRLHKAHRLVWMYVHGTWPARQLDHINGDRRDNRIENLRESTNAENAQNRGRHFKNKSGYTGVHWVHRLSKYVAYITHMYRRRHLGVFDTAEEAYAAYCQAKAALHEFQPTPR